MHYWRTALFLLFAFFLASCEAEITTQPNLRGNISGFAGLRDGAGVRSEDQSGIVVSIKGMSSTTTTKEDGSWTLADVPAGIYDIEFSKEGFASNRIRAYQFVGGGTAYISGTLDLIETSLDTMRVTKVSFEPSYIYTLRDTLIETDTGWYRPTDTIEVPNQYLVIEGIVLLEHNRDTATLYLQPYYTDLSVVPSTNNLVGTVTQDENTISLRVPYLVQYGYPTGVPVDVVLTTRLNNTYYYEPSTRKRVVTDPHDLLRLRITLSPQ